mmetsp:Transcript_57647/g.185211  ORF Transcript_57647/g.185211 Transcript_57647/m.185211 type:complete len:297 (-) Transcript_57647:292-1182(-)
MCPATWQIPRNSSCQSARAAPVMVSKRWATSLSLSSTRSSPSACRWSPRTSSTSNLAAWACRCWTPRTGWRSEWRQHGCWTLQGRREPLRPQGPSSNARPRGGRGREPTGLPVPLQPRGLPALRLVPAVVAGWCDAAPEPPAAKAAAQPRGLAPAPPAGLRHDRSPARWRPAPPPGRARQPRRARAPAGRPPIAAPVPAVAERRLARGWPPAEGCAARSSSCSAGGSRSPPAPSAGAMAEELQGMRTGRRSARLRSMRIPAAEPRCFGLPDTCSALPGGQLCLQLAPRPARLGCRR